MICLKIKNTKEFMQKFLMSDAFSDFLLMESKVDTCVSHSIDGRIRRDFYTKEEQEMQELWEFTAWESVRPHILTAVKGKRTPLFMKQVLAYHPKKAQELLESAEQEAGSGGFVKYLLCTVKYENGMVTMTGGVSYQGFTMDKEPEKCWDQALCRLTDAIGLEYEII